MNNKFKNITAIILLVILPISAIGLDVNIHKCKHKGTIHIAFFDYSNRKSNSDCCCSSCEIGISANDDADEFCDHDNKVKKESKCSESNMPIHNELNSNSCGMEEQQQKKDNTPSCEHPVNNHIALPGINYLNKSCCTNSELSLTINLAFISFEKNNLLTEKHLPVYNLFQKRNIDTKPNNLQHVKDVKYPLKKLICSIITFIHFTSIKGDETDIPFLNYC